MLPPSVRTLSTTMEPSAPAFAAIWRIGSSRARWMILAPVRSSPSRESSRSATGCWACKKRHATAGHDALFEGRPGRRECVLDAVLLLLELRLGRGADLDDGHAAGQLGEPLLELLAVEVRVGGLDLGADLVDAARDPLGLAGTVDDGGLVLGDDDLAGAARAG